ncbi:3-oxoacyl-[acyl-carrier protein] reductase [Roseateles sp. YR242]|uniref:3-oxoacyl-ACP reductase n=1 Tax=Roseateles sp. YR242 TaxID=1855305 RepID=UPI0008BF814F|nr:3-oxoacyl-ACP reductase [Roseateles sp. YR242]SEL65359.1 3-oxoacyl-[acyl-carrier protein] reductase [Roseateles sp. YR242]
MTDRLLELAQRPWGQRLLRALGLPQPQRLRRREGPWAEQELAGRPVQLIGIGAAPLMSALTRDVATEGGAQVADSQAHVATLVVDATGAMALGDLKDLFRQVQAALPRLVSGARVLLLAADPASLTLADKAAVAQAVQGFGRSLAKELGRRGATVTTLLVPAGTHPSMVGALRFFGTDRSAYVSGQVIRWGAMEAPHPAELLEHTGTRQRVAVVTGAAGGIGTATVKALASAGYRVLCVDVPAAQDALTSLAAAVSGEALAVDLTDAATPARLAAAAASHNGIDLVVHNAGITRDRTLARMSATEWDSVLAVNLGAILAIDQALDAQGLWRVGAREVCLSSISGIAGNAGQTNYSASKAALIGYVTARAAAMQPRGITVNAVAPGFIETAMTRRMPLMIREAGRRLNSLKQGGRPEDVAQAIAFLATPQAQPMTGAVLRVCGQSLLGA